MSTDKTPPQPRFRIWDRVFYKGSGSPIEQTVIGINWDDYHKDYEVTFAPLPQNVDSQFAMNSDPNLRLVSRPGLEPQQVTPVPPQEQYNPRDSNHWSGTQSETLQKDPWFGMKHELEHTKRAQCETQTPAETLQQKVARLKEEAMTCDDKSWLGKFAAWKEAEAGIEVADPQAQVTLAETRRVTELLASAIDRITTLEKEVGRIHWHMTPIGPKLNPFDQWARPVVIGTDPASDNKDG